MKRVAIVMAGGAGERFWPVSRLARPKQLLRLTDPRMSLLEEAVQRAEPLFGKEGVYVATGKSVEVPIAASGVVGEDRLFVEPLKRNTLGCLCWVAANFLAQGNEDVSMAVLTADHRIDEPDRFRDCVRRALETAEQTGALVTIGIRPTRPETGFGYVEAGGQMEPAAGVFRAKSFREKPDRATAEEFIASGSFYWNSGMMFWTLSSFMAELENAQPEAAQITRAMSESLKTGDLASAELQFAGLPNISIDFALMEKAGHVQMVASTFGWDDVGAWDALDRTFARDEAGNVAFGETMLIDSRGMIVYNDCDKAFVGAVGLENILVVVTSDAVLVCPKSEAQRVREIVQELKERRPDLI